MVKIDTLFILKSKLVFKSKIGLLLSYNFKKIIYALRFYNKKIIEFVN